jgi:hypothetical protein
MKALLAVAIGFRECTNRRADRSIKPIHGFSSFASMLRTTRKLSFLAFRA